MCSVKIEPVEDEKQPGNELQNNSDVQSLNNTENLSIKEELEDFDVDELLKDDGSEQVVDKQDKEASQLVIQCPTCFKEFLGLNRLKLHIDSNHEYQEERVQCQICGWRMLGKGYEDHVLLTHRNLLNNDQYMLAPRVMTKRRILPVPTPPPEKYDGPGYQVQFNSENPWQDILSTSSRQKRNIDAGLISKIMSTKATSETLDEDQILSLDIRHRQISKMLLQGTLPHVANCKKLQQKIEFIGGLELNSYYKNYLENYRQYKIRTKLLEKFKDKLSVNQKTAMQEKINNDEKTLLQTYVPIGNTPDHLFADQKNIRDKINSIKEIKVTKEKIKQTQINQILGNLRAKGVLAKPQIHKISKPSPSPPKKIFVPSQKLKADLMAMLASNNSSIIQKSILPKSNSKLFKILPKPTAPPAKDPLAFEDEGMEHQESGPLHCQTVSAQSVIALNIPMEDIIEKPSSDLKLKADISIKQEC